MKRPNLKPAVAGAWLAKLPAAWREAPRGGALVPMALAALVIVCALIVVRVQHSNRVLTKQLDAQREHRDQLQIEWAQLRLEEATLSRNAAIEVIARERLDMYEPREYDVVEMR